MVVLKATVLDSCDPRARFLPLASPTEVARAGPGNLRSQPGTGEARSGQAEAIHEPLGWHCRQCQPCERTPKMLSTPPEARRRQVRTARP